MNNDVFWQPCQREVVENVQGIYRTLWCLGREMQRKYKGELVWDQPLSIAQASHIILSLHLGMESLAGWWKIEFLDCIFQVLRVCVSLYRRACLQLWPPHALVMEKPHRVSGVLGWPLKMRRRNMCRKCKAVEKHRECRVTPTTGRAEMGSIMH